MARSTIDADKTGSAAIIAGQMRFVREHLDYRRPGLGRADVCRIGV